MATYFHGAPEIQPDSLQTLYLMNPSYVAGGYSDAAVAAAAAAAAAAAPAAQQASMVFLNSPLSSLSSVPQPHQQQQQQHHFVGIPLQPLSNDPNRPLPSMQPTSIQYNLWAPAPSANAANPVDIQAQLGPRRPGLSLSLSPQQAQFAAASSGAEEARFVVGSSSSDRPAGLQSVLMGSKYLKAAQQLLDEVVSIGRAEAAAAKANDSSTKISTKSIKDLDGDGDGNGNGNGKKAAELSTAERQELQMKKAKLVNMLDEVEQRYRQYHHQMQVVVSSFEAVAGAGSAKTYTALALQTISKQFRCLRDAISGQIRATGKSLGEEEDCMAGGGSKSVGSRLRFVDHHLRQQRVLQQLGMIQHNAWRPQRGLPERAVSVLRAWLFEHFLHPYPKDSDKHMLAKQTGLTRSQVSNWFINARVRLWKPMVEEMYLEETKEQEQKNGGGGDKASKSEDSEHSASKSASQQANSSTPSRTEQTDTNPTVTVPSSDLAMFSNHSDGAIMQQKGLKKQRSDMSLHHNAMAASQMSMEEMKPEELSNRELLMKFMDQGAGFGAYPIGEIGRFDHEQFAPRFSGNGVSLTLGLPHCETLSLSGSQQANYLSNDSMPHLGSEESNYFSLSNSDANNPSASNAYGSINIQNRKRFAAQLLPDFVA